jgi:hypothetical protein
MPATGRITMPAQFLVIPLYSHTSDAEVVDLLAQLDQLGFAQAPYLARGTMPEATTLSRRCECGEPEDGGEFGFFDQVGDDGASVTRCNACGSVV